MIRVLIPILALLGTAPAAQPPRALAWDDSVATRKLSLVAGKSSVELGAMHPSQRTAPLRIKGDGPLVIRADDRNGADGTPVTRPCPIPESVVKPLIVLLPDPKDPTGIRPLVLDDDPDSFRFGEFRFLNATPKELVVQLEKQAKRVPPGWKPTDILLEGDRRGIGARVALGEAIETALYTAVWEHNPDVRTLCIMVPGDDPRLSPVLFKAIPEDRIILELEAEPAPAD